GATPPRQVHARSDEAAEDAVEDVRLGEVPAVAGEIGLDVELRRLEELPERLDPIGWQPRLTLLGDHDLLTLGDVTERSRDRTSVASRPDDDRGLERAMLAHDADPVRIADHCRHAGALSHVRAGRPRAVQEIVVELPADDAVTGRRPPAGLVAGPLELEPAGGEGLDGERGLVRVDLGVRHRLRRDPARAHLPARTDGRARAESPQT